jgi:hypothetical protein
MTLSKKVLFVTIGITLCHNDECRVLFVAMLDVVTLSVVVPLKAATS